MDGKRSSKRSFSLTSASALKWCCGPFLRQPSRMPRWRAAVMAKAFFFRSARQIGKRMVSGKQKVRTDVAGGWLQYVDVDMPIHAAHLMSPYRLAPRRRRRPSDFRVVTSSRVVAPSQCRNSPPDVCVRASFCVGTSISLTFGYELFFSIN